MSSDRVVAFVPMRHGSERVPGKNMRVLAGRPLYHYVVRSLLAVQVIDEVVIDTDSDPIRSDAASAFPEVRVIERPSHLAGGDVPMNAVLLNAVEQVDADIYLQTHSTSPLLRPGTIEAALRAFKDSPSSDSLFTVTRLQARLWSAETSPMNHDPARLERTQDLIPLYLENSALYVFTRESLMRTQGRIGERPQMFELDASEAWDVDEEDDLLVVEALLGTREGT